MLNSFLKFSPFYKTSRFLSSSKLFFNNKRIISGYKENSIESLLPVEEHEERTGLPVIAILGRPNVGKSTLFNCFVRLFSGRYKNSSIVTKIPGTTRDRIYAFLEIPDTNQLDISRCMLIDTGGISSSSTKFTSNHTHSQHKNNDKFIDNLIRQQAFIAMEQANAIIYITDAKEGITQIDKQIASWLRKTYKGLINDRVVLVVNKVDNDERSEHVDKFIRLGLGEPIACSAAHSLGLSEVFYKALLKMIKYKDTPIHMVIGNKNNLKKETSNDNETYENIDDNSESDDYDNINNNELWDTLFGKNKSSQGLDIYNIKQNTDLKEYDDKLKSNELKFIKKDEQLKQEIDDSMFKSKMLKLAILGRPNVGKSSLLNAITGKNRAIVSNVAGTTHDPIDEKITWRNETDILLVDTAGIRRKGNHKIGIESLTILWAMQIIERSEVILLVIDAKEGILRQDKRLASEILSRNRSVIVVVNKWDGKVKRKNKLSNYEKYVRKELNFLSFVPVVFTSAMNKENLEPIIDLSILVGKERRQRIPTRKLMEIIKSMDHRGPGSKKKYFKIKFISQARVQSPTFAVFATNVNLCTDSYKRYVENCIRAKYQFTGTPIRLIVTDPPRKSSPKQNSNKFKKPYKKDQ